jgi:hypothetical protein
MNESVGASSSSPAASGSRTNTQPTTNTARNTNTDENVSDRSAARSLIWSDRSYIHHGMFAGRHMRLVRATTHFKLRSNIMQSNKHMTSRAGGGFRLGVLV